MIKNYGHFARDGQEYVITDPATPRHWYNYLWNDHYVSFTSQVGYGEGFAQDDLGRRAMLVINRMLYLIDTADNSSWTANALPVNQGYRNYRCTHGIGYTEITLEYAGIVSALRLFVPRGDSAEVWSLRLENTRPVACTLKAIAYVKTAMDTFYRPQGYDLGGAEFDPELQAVVSRNFMKFGSGTSRLMHGYLMSAEPASAYDGRNDAFIGPYGDDLRPAALEQGGCRNSNCISEKICFALEQWVALAPGETRELHFVAGVARDRTEITGIRRRLLSPGGVAAEFESTRDKLAADIAGFSIETPDEGLNNLFNGFLKHQTSLGSRWARVRHNGFRDTNCDCECLGLFNPELAWERAKRIIAYQYSNGYAPRTFLDGKIIDHDYIDNTVWITFNVYHLLKERGELSMLEEIVPYNDGSESTVYEHLRRSVDFLWKERGELGLVKIWGGDWNDCFKWIGPKRKGMSVWLSIAWYLANKQFAEIARLSGRNEDAGIAEARGAEMRRIVNDVAWDGGHYLIAITDDGEKLGTVANEEGKIHLIAQAWAVLAGIGTDGKAGQAMDSVDRLMNTDLGCLMSWPAYTRQYLNIGDVSEKLPGVHENGGVYLHACTWKLAADCLLKRNERVQEDLEKLLPANFKWGGKHCEPYIMCNSYFPKEAGYRYATPGQSWRTGTGAWFLKAIAYYIFGLQPDMDGLRLSPCLPPDWRICSIRKRFRGADYMIRYEQADLGGCNRIRTIMVNGKPHGGEVLPWAPNGRFEVKVTLGKQVA